MEREYHAGFLPAGRPRIETEMDSTGWTGRGVERVDGRAKVTGTAGYSGDVAVPGMAHAVLVQAKVARAQLIAVDTAQAEQAPGVLAVFTDACFAPGLAPIGPPPEEFTQSFPAERRAPLSDNVVHYAGQHIALVVAETLEQATFAATLVHMEYELLEPELTLRAGLPGSYKPHHFATNSKEALNRTRGERPARADVLVDALFRTPVVHHNPMEPSATVACWQGDELTLHDSTRWVQGSRKVIAHMLGVPAEKVHVHAPVVGGAFGSKGFLWQHVALAAQAARVLRRPVKLVLTRQQMFTSTGHRPETSQQVTLSADSRGALTGAGHHSLMDTSPVSHFVEPCGLTTRNLYTTPYASISHTVAPLNRASPCFMRAPGESPGMFALETAMDELAAKLGLDPMELRLRNDTQEDRDENRPWSGRHLRECCERGAALFGWQQRSPVPRSMQREGKLVGWGMATAAYPARRSPAAVRARVSADGVATFSAATHEIGCGTATAMQQVAADALDWPYQQVRFVLGDSDLPQAPVAGASQTAASVSPAVQAAGRQLQAALVRAAVRDEASPLFGVAPESVSLRDGVLCCDARREACVDVLARLPGGELACESRTETEPAAREGYTFHSFGAHFAEVTWDEQIAELRVTRWVSVMDCGRVLNHRTARSQIEGGVLFGLGMALMEETHYDPRSGAPVNANLAEYHVPTCADAPEFTVEFVEYPDLHLNPLGVRGIGEIGITGVPAALGNAIYHSTGVRLRELPMTVDRILAGKKR